ncbi:EamA family transporter [Sphingobacterium bovistauri]|uniref:EamA family transporter n=1 Tax=Sphingobacterium bovistauri TaxID=2781959 RepID=A0ABS7Z607_9SPHI|nr:DMT family transporter [Sphingobacterium bovistauri]MCA5005625.1 EamA family transporter [Sphingobacterium bovistauri]
MKRFQGAIAVLIGAASFGVLSTFVKKAYKAGFSLGEVTGVQALLGMMILWIIFLLMKASKVNFSNFSRKTPFWKIIVAGFSTGLVSILYYKCVQLVPASIAIVLLMQFIWIGALINYILFKQIPTQKQSIGIILILIATIFATGALESSIKEISITGILYGLLAALAYAIFIIVNGKIGNDYPPVQKSALMVTGACIIIFLLLQPVSLFDMGDNTQIYQFGMLLAVFGTVLPPFLFAFGMPKIDLALGSILSAVELPVAVAMSYFVLHENVSILQWLGVGAILAIVVWINYKNKSEFK